MTNIADNLNYKGNDPGAAKYGNFINYYTFHSVNQRISNLNPLMFPKSDKPILCLDIGCNTGDLTVLLLEYLKTVYPNVNIHILAIDIDPTLIDRANDTNKSINITFKTLNITSQNRKDVKEFLYKNGKQSFDITFCLSVTMWIHLNNGDEGLVNFLEYIKSISRSIIIEVQPWRCYRNAQRRLRKSGADFPLYDHLKIRSNVETVIENILSSGIHIKAYESNKSSWQRKIKSFQLQSNH